MKNIVDRLCSQHKLNADEYRKLLICENVDAMEYLRSKAQEVAIGRFEKKIYIRGLIEISNRCKNNCLYCGIRRGNKMVSRYSLSRETILLCCKKGYELGFRTFVLQGGEDASFTDEWLVDVVSSISKAYPDCAVTLSLGERSRLSYQQLYDAGARRYLLRHETFNKNHYQLLHPAEMSRDNRLQCLRYLKDIGYQTGTGIMVGSPGQTIDYIVEDLLFMQNFKPEMIGIGPFIPHADTPFKDVSAGSVSQTLRLISICRLMFPSALIPATTALSSLEKDGRLKGVLAGANVVMPNLSPTNVRAKYALYNNKASLGAESAEGLLQLETELSKINYQISEQKGDYIDCK